MSAADTAPAAVDGGEELVHPLADVMPDQRVTALVSSLGKVGNNPARRSSLPLVVTISI